MAVARLVLERRAEDCPEGRYDVRKRGRRFGRAHESGHAARVENVAGRPIDTQKHNVNTLVPLERWRSALLGWATIEDRALRQLALRREMEGVEAG